MATVWDTFGFTPQERAAATFTVAGEAGPGKDIYGPLATLINRKLSGYGGSKSSIVDLATQPGQFEANRGYTANQVADPAFGRKVHGAAYDQLDKQLGDLNQFAPVYNQLKGAVEFRGQALLQNRHKDDPMLDPKGNFYFNYNKNAFQQGSALIARAGAQSQAQNQQPTVNPNQQTLKINQYFFGDREYNSDTDQLFKNTPLSFLQNYMQNISKTQFNPTTALAAAAFSSSPYGRYDTGDNN